MNTLSNAVGRSTYPGRGIIIGLSADAQAALCAYFIMGRSENSRNRVFAKDGDGLRTRAHDPSKLSDPSLVIYPPVRVRGNQTVITNGDQTDTIMEHLDRGDTFAAALRTRTFEPDPPNWTPRISGLVTVADGSLSYRMSILKSADGNPGACLRFFYEYETPLPGLGHFLHTYADDGDPLPSFAGEPEPVALQGGLDEITETIWAALNEDNRVALFVRSIRLSDGLTQSRIRNKLA